MSKKYLLYTLLACLTLFLGYFIYKNSNNIKSNKEEVRILRYEIQKLNKMIVLEEEWKGIKKEKIESDIPFNLENDYVNLTKTEIEFDVSVKTQVTYNMKKLEIDLDSLHKKIHIKYVPEPELQYFPNLKVRNMKQGWLNQLSKEDINKAEESAKNSVIKQTNPERIKKIAHKTLIENLRELYKVAEIYNWKIVDDTKYQNEIQKIKD